MAREARVLRVGIIVSEDPGMHGHIDEARRIDPDVTAAFERALQAAGRLHDYTRYVKTLAKNIPKELGRMGVEARVEVLKGLPGMNLASDCSSGRTPSNAELKAAFEKMDGKFDFVLGLMEEHVHALPYYCHPGTIARVDAHHDSTTVNAAAMMGITGVDVTSSNYVRCAVKRGITQPSRIRHYGLRHTQELDGELLGTPHSTQHFENAKFDLLDVDADGLRKAGGNTAFGVGSVLESSVHKAVGRNAPKFVLAAHFPIEEDASGRMRGFLTALVVKGALSRARKLGFTVKR